MIMRIQSQVGMRSFRSGDTPTRRRGGPYLKTGVSPPIRWWGASSMAGARSRRLRRGHAGDERDEGWD